MGTTCSGALSDVPSLTSEQGASSFSSTRQTPESAAQSYFYYLVRRSWQLDEEEEEEFFDTQQFLGEEPLNAWEQFLVSGPVTTDVYRETVDFR